MIFNNGYVHCDPHPGNVLVKKSDDEKVSIILLDHGLYLVSNPLSPMFLILEIHFSILIVKKNLFLQNVGLLPRKTSLSPSFSYSNDEGQLFCKLRQLRSGQYAFCRLWMMNSEPDMQDYGLRY